MDRSLKIAVGSFGVSLMVLAIKYGAYAITGSVALYSDALESIINVATAVAVIVAVWVAARPPDAEHPYGHQKAEYLSAVVVGVLIVGAAVAIFHEAYAGFLAPKPTWLRMVVHSNSSISSRTHCGSTSPSLHKSANMMIGCWAASQQAV